MLIGRVTITCRAQAIYDAGIRAVTGDNSRPELRSKVSYLYGSLPGHSLKRMRILTRYTMPSTEIAILGHRNDDGRVRR